MALPSPPTRGRRGGCTGRRPRSARRRSARRAPGGPGRWTSLFSRERPNRRTRAGGQRAGEGVLPRQRERRRRSLVGRLVLVVVGPRPGDGVHQDRRACCRAAPGCARSRSPPGAARRPLSRSRLTAAGTSSAQARRRRPRARRVGRGEDLVVADRPEQIEGRLVLGLGLAAEADDDVGADRDPGHGRPDPLQALPVVGDRVLAAHPAQDGVVARLDRAGGGPRRPTGSRPSPRRAGRRGPRDAT